ncbi:MAG: phosphoglucomutase [Candidatus Marinimicrobia bacterium]|nr:phosphoglucomutase [Candidatus Neomarinimicrobiota bacterium]
MNPLIKVEDPPKIIFGTDGWRGLIDKEVNEDTIGIVAAALGEYLLNKKKNPTCIIGYDGRKGSEEFATTFNLVLSGMGIEAEMLTMVTPTPIISYLTRWFNYTAGVMITASHNPPEYNGVKFKANYGGPFMTEETKKVEDLISDTFLCGCIATSTDNIWPYKLQINSTIDFDAIYKADIIPLIDSMGGAGQTYIEDHLSYNEIFTQTIYGEAKPDFSGRAAEPIEKNLVPLADALKASDEYCCGFATDGDADRLGVMMENGEWLSAQETILYLTDYVINVRKEKGCIIKTSSVTDKVNLLVSEEHPLHEVQVGFKYICEQMLKTWAAIGCEESGGFGYGMHMPERDGIFSALIFLEMLAKSGHKKLSDFVKAKRKQFGEICYNRIDHQFDHPDRISILPMIYEKKLTTFSGFDIVETQAFNSSRGIVNGLKFRLKGSCRWLLLRASETEPLMRIYAEGQNNEEVDLFLKEGIRLISE